jgi:hypothetical protein
MFFSFLGFVICGARGNARQRRGRGAARRHAACERRRARAFCTTCDALRFASRRVFTSARRFFSATALSRASFLISATCACAAAASRREGLRQRVRGGGWRRRAAASAQPPARSRQPPRGLAGGVAQALRQARRRPRLDGLLLRLLPHLHVPVGGRARRRGGGAPEVCFPRAARHLAGDVVVRAPLVLRHVVRRQRARVHRHLLLRRVLRTHARSAHKARNLRLRALPTRTSSSVRLRLPPLGCELSRLGMADLSWLLAMLRKSTSTKPPSVAYCRGRYSSASAIAMARDEAKRQARSAREAGRAGERDADGLRADAEGRACDDSACAAARLQRRMAREAVRYTHTRRGSVQQAVRSIEVGALAQPRPR